MVRLGRDSFRSPSRPEREFTVLPADTNPDQQDLEGADNVIVLSSSGAETHSSERVALDRLKLNPRLSKQALGEIVESANYRWALGDSEQEDASHA